MSKVNQPNFFKLAAEGVEPTAPSSQNVVESSTNESNSDFRDKLNNAINFKKIAEDQSQEFRKGSITKIDEILEGAIEQSLDKNKDILETKSQDVDDTVSEEEVQSESQDVDDTVSEGEVQSESQDLSVESEQSEKKPAPVKKKLAKAKIGDEYIDLDLEAKLKHKVDGQEVEVALEELLNQYSGKMAYDKKFSELDKDRKSFQKDKEVVETYLKEFAKRAQTDAVDAFEYLAEVVGQDPLEFRRAMRHQMLEKSKQYSNLDEQTLKKFELEEENNYLKSKRERELQTARQMQADKDHQEKVMQSLKQNDISEARLNELLSDLESHAGKGAVTLENVVALHKAYIKQDFVADVLRDIDPAWENDSEKLSTLEGLLGANQSMDKEKLKNTALKLWGDKSEERLTNLQKKVKKPVENSTPKKPKSVSLNSYDFSDFMGFQP